MVPLRTEIRRPARRPRRATATRNGLWRPPSAVAGDDPRTMDHADRLEPSSPPRAGPSSPREAGHLRAPTRTPGDIAGARASVRAGPPAAPARVAHARARERERDRAARP